MSWPRATSKEASGKAASSAAAVIDDARAVGGQHDEGGTARARGQQHPHALGEGRALHDLVHVARGEQGRATVRARRRHGQVEQAQVGARGRVEGGGQNHPGAARGIGRVEARDGGRVRARQRRQPLREGRLVHAAGL